MVRFTLFCLSHDRALWLLYKGRLCRQEPDCQMEKAGLWESVLLALHPNQRHQLWNQLHLQSPQDKAGSCKSELNGFTLFPLKACICTSDFISLLRKTNIRKSVLCRLQVVIVYFFVCFTGEDSWMHSLWLQRMFRLNAVFCTQSLFF